MEYRHPAGKQVVPSVGPLDAEIVTITESPAGKELKLGVPLVGMAGRTYDMGLSKAGIDRSAVRIINLVPVRAPGDKFDAHSESDLRWGHDMLMRELDQLRGPKIIIPMGFHPLNWLTGGMAPIASLGLTPYRDLHHQTHGGISDWRGSLMEPRDDILGLNAQYHPLTDTPMVPTLHPAAVARQMEWHVDFIRDLKRAKQFVEGRLPSRPRRATYFSDLPAFERLVHLRRKDVMVDDAAGIGDLGNRPVVDLIAFDSEMDEAELISVATEDEVHVFSGADERFLVLFKELMESPWVCKVAHNFQHDAVWLRHKYDIHIVPPRFDTYGGAHILNPSLEKSLSPGISARFTSWFYHKWLEQVNGQAYCGTDAAVTYDAFWPMTEELYRRGLTDVSKHDHKLMDIFTEMTIRGFKVDTSQRLQVETELSANVALADAVLNTEARFIIAHRLDRFQKPHLFQDHPKCSCCGGGTLQRKHCWKCAVTEGAFLVAVDIENVDLKAVAKSNGFKSLKAFKASWPECETCHGTGKVDRWLDFSADSPDQVADVVYRGLGIYPRRFKGKETVRIKQLELLKDMYPLVARIVNAQIKRAELETVQRLKPGQDGRLHCVFDPWGTRHGRVAGKEGLILPGTNPMNIPHEARVFVVPDDSKVLLYPDMEQVEARNMAVLTGDPALLAALTELDPDKGKPDLHTFVVRLLKTEAHFELVAKSALERDTPRQQAKKLEYAAFYGIRAPNLAKEMGYTVDEAERALKAFYFVFNKVPRWHAAILEEALETRELKSPTGRICTWLGHIYDPKTKGVSYETAKEMWSFKPQDMAAWVLALGMIELATEHPDVLDLLIHVHDAALSQADLTRLPEAITIAQSTLTRRIWDMDYPAGIKTGPNWRDMK